MQEALERPLTNEPGRLHAVGQDSRRDVEATAGDTVEIGIGPLRQGRVRTDLAERVGALTGATRTVVAAAALLRHEELGARRDQARVGRHRVGGGAKRVDVLEERRDLRVAGGRVHGAQRRESADELVEALRGAGPRKQRRRHTARHRLLVPRDAPQTDHLADDRHPVVDGERRDHEVECAGRPAGVRMLRLLGEHRLRDAEQRKQREPELPAQGGIAGELVERWLHSGDGRGVVVRRTPGEPGAQRGHDRDGEDMATVVVAVVRCPLRSRSGRGAR